MINSKSHIVIWLSILFISCNNKSHTTVEFISTSLDTTIKATRISITELAEKYKSLHGQYIETEGTFYYEFENVSICVDSEKNSKCFWLDLNNNLVSNYNLLTNASSRRFIIKGVVDTLSKGHLSYYMATIGNIYYLAEK